MLFMWPTYTTAYFLGGADATRKPPAIYFTLLSNFTRQLSEIKVGNELISLNMDCSIVLLFVYCPKGIPSALHANLY